MSPPLTTFDVPKHPCPFCGKEHDEATEVRPGSPAPYPGGFVVCTSCATILVYTDTLALRLPTPGELARLQASRSWPLVCLVVTQIRSRL